MSIFDATLRQYGSKSRAYTARLSHGGEGEIRTLGSLRYACFPSKCTRPLCDLSSFVNCAGIIKEKPESFKTPSVGGYDLPYSVIAFAAVVVRGPKMPAASSSALAMIFFSIWKRMTRPRVMGPKYPVTCPESGAMPKWIARRR